jgi:hypothetical protein
MFKIRNLFRKKKPKSEFRQKVEANREIHKNLKAKWDNSKLIAKGKQIGLQEAFVSAAGNIFYTHTNILDVVFVRYLEMLKALQKIEFNLTSDELKLSLMKIRNAAKNKDERTVYLTCDDIELRMTRLPQKRAIIDLALCMIYRHDENPYNYNAIIQSKKIEEMKIDGDLEVFFCEEGWEMTKPYLGENLEDFKTQSVQDFLNHILQTQKEKAIG